MFQNVVSNNFIPPYIAGKGYKLVKSQRGKDLVMIENYTFANKCRRKYDNNWCCSTTQACKARLVLDKEGNIIFLNNNHCHPPRKFFVTNDGKFVMLTAKYPSISGKVSRMQFIS